MRLTTAPKKFQFTVEFYNPPQITKLTYLPFSSTLPVARKILEVAKQTSIVLRRNERRSARRVRLILSGVLELGLPSLGD